MTDEFIIWAHDYTPSIDCAQCGERLVEDPNGNAPLQFTLADLVNAAQVHSCQGRKG